MKENKTVELIELDEKRRWEYLKRYYEVSAEFFNAGGKVIHDEEIDVCLKNFKEKPSPVFRRKIKLDEWKFNFDKNKNGIRREYYSRVYDENQWEDVKIPHSYRHVPDDPVRFGKFGEMLYGEPNPEHANPAQGNIWKSEYHTWYKKRLALDKPREDEVVYLTFDSVNLVCDVWVNESPVMIDHLGLFPFKMEVTEEMCSKVCTNRETVIALKVVNVVSNTPFFFYNGFQYAYCNPPYVDKSSNKDWYDEAWSGIADNASILILNRTHLEDIFIFTENITADEAFVIGKTKKRNNDWEKFKGKIIIELSKWHPDEREIIKKIEKSVSCLPMNEEETEISIKIENPELWTIAEPNLYLAHFILVNEKGNEIDDMYETFGVRTIKMMGSNFYLNNKKIVPRGTHNAISYLKESEICPTDRSIVKDILLHKKMGANCSRWPSDIKMHYKKIAQYCDQMGFMLVWTGFFEVWMVHPELELYSVRDAGAMVRSLRNCPSIIMWEMGDEPLMLIHSFRRFKWYEQIYNLVKKEDKTRPIVPAGSFCLELVDLIENFKDKSLSHGEKRRKVLEDLPVYGLDMAVWDYHYCPEVPPIVPCYTIVNKVKEALGGERPTVFTEFGFDGMPEPTLELIEAYEGKFRWATDAMWGFDRKTADINYFGRELDSNDWRETQACQAIVLSNIVCYLRGSPDEFAAFYFMTMFDIWTFYWGLVDISDNPKLAYYVAGNSLQPVCITGLHGSTVVQEQSSIEVMLSNFDNPVPDAELNVNLKNIDNEIIMHREFSGIMIKGNVSVTSACMLELTGITKGLYSIEYFLFDKNEKELAKNIELFYIA